MNNISTPSPEKPEKHAPVSERSKGFFEKFNRFVEIGRNILMGARQLFGIEPALVPIKKGTKIPLKKGWQDTSSIDNENPAHLFSLGKDERSTGVLLGAASQNLVALDFDKRSHAETFIKGNLSISETLMTHGNRGLTMWFIMEGEYPKSYDLRDPAGGNFVEFRADGRLSIFRGMHPSGKEYQVVWEALPKRIEYATINWPTEWNISDAAVEPVLTPASISARDYIAQSLATTCADENRFGEPITVGEKGKIQVDFFAFADSYARAHPVVYVPNIGFHVYDDQTGFWSLVPMEEIYRRLGFYMEWIAKVQGIDSIRGLRRPKFLTEFLIALRGLIAIAWPVTQHHLLHLANGMLELGKGDLKLLPFAPEYHSLTAIPHEFQPEAQCPLWLEFLKNALPPEDVELLQKWCGQTLTGFNATQAILLLTGVGGAGKGVIVKVISAIIGRSNCAELRTEHLGSRFEMSMLYGKPLLIGSDVPGDFLSNKHASHIKALVGHDPLKAEFKFEPRPAEFLGTFNMIITSNQRLRVALDGDEEAYRRRLKIIDFTKPATKQIPDFAERLLAESAGILRWMVDGLLKLHCEIEREGKWVLAESQLARVDELLAESDSLRAFIKSCVVKADEDAKLTNSDLQIAYHQFCDDNGWMPHSVRYFQKTHPHLMLELHHVSQRHDIPFAGFTRRGYTGVMISRDKSTEA